MTENIAPEVESQINTNFMEQRLVNTQKAFPFTSSHLSEVVDKEMADGSWFAKQQLMKPIQIGQYQWTVSQTRNTNIADFSIPAVFANIESLTLRTLRMYAFYKLSPIIRVQINSTQFHQGQLIAAFDPFSLTVNSKVGDVYSLIYATGLPHVKIMASESDSIELELPFTHPRSFLTTNSNTTFNNLGHFYLTVMNPLVVAEGTSPTVTATIWIYAKEADVHVPIFDHNPILEPTSGKMPTSDVPVQTPTLASTLKKGFKQTTDMVGNFMTLQFGQALRKGQGLIDTLGELFGFDYPSDPISPQKFITPIENLAVGKGKSRSQRLAIDPYSLHNVDDSIASESRKAMSLLSIAKMPMLLNQFTFSSTDAQDSLLFSCPVHPQISPVFLTDTAGGVQRTYLSFVSNAFCYWSGGIKFDIEVVATRFHSGKLLVAYVPNSQDIPTYQQATLLPNVIIDIQQTSNTTFTVPYTSSTPMKSTILLADATPAQYVDACTGTLVIYVQNLLTHASNVSPSIEINTYIYGAEDFSLYIPRRPVVNYTNKKKQLLVEPTSGISIMSHDPSSTSAVLSKDQDLSIPRHHFGEEYNLLDLIRRFSYLSPTTYEKLNESVYQPIVAINPFDYDLNVTIDTYPNNYVAFINYFSRIYSCWVGTLRYKLVFPVSRTNTDAYTLYHIPDTQLELVDKYNVIYPGYDQNYLANGYGTLCTTLSQDNSIEFEVPYYSKYNMLLTRASGAPGISDEYVFNGKVYSVNTASESDPKETTTSGKLYIAAGEDFRFIYLRPPPVNSSVDFAFVTTLK